VTQQSEPKEADWLKKARSRAWSKPTAAFAKVPMLPLTIATFFFTGLSPLASGTVGSLAAALLYYFIPALQNNIVLAAAVIVLFIIGVWASNIVERAIDEHDPGIIVADEAVGQWIALLSLSYTGNWFFVLVAFLAFRFFDIIKLYPASAVEKRQGGFSVMFDDVIAGVYANIAAHIVTWLAYRFVLTH
jgi:phosphatidylglycerophosphatase A